MKQGALCFLLFVGCCLCPSPMAAQELKVGILGDQTGSYDLARSYQILGQAVDLLHREKVDLVLHVGDLLESTRDETAIRQDFQTAVALLGRLNVPWRITPGDHDVNPGDWRADSPDRSKERLFRELLRPFIPELPREEERLYYSFDYSGYHFIALNALEHLHTDPRWGNVFLARLSEEQLAWLREDLRQHGDSLGTIVFLHQPLWYNQAGWRPVHRLLREYGVKAVIAGHFHYDQDEGEIDGIRYLVIGASGAAVKRANPASGGMHQAAVLRLRDGSLFWRLFDVVTAEETDWTSRADADRVQALDYVLGGMLDFAGLNKFFLQGDNRLVANCRSGEPAQLRLAGIGNPIDLPVRLTIQAESDHVRLVAPPFTPCTAQDNTMECKLVPGSGIAVSNPATASVCFPLCPGSNLQSRSGLRLDEVKQEGQESRSSFSAAILPGEAKKIAAGEVLHFRIELSFIGQQGIMAVFRELQTAPLSVCAQ